MFPQLDFQIIPKKEHNPPDANKHFTHKLPTIPQLLTANKNENEHFLTTSKLLKNYEFLKVKRRFGKHKRLITKCCMSIHIKIKFINDRNVCGSRLKNY